MKKITFISLAFFGLQFTGNAQHTEFGFTAGAVLSNYRIKPADASSDLTAQLGICLGVIADLPVGKRFSFQPALNFLQKGTKNSYKPTGASPEFTHIDVNYVEMPLNFLFNTNGKTAGFFIGAGPAIAVAVSGKTKLVAVTNAETRNLVFGNGDNDDMKRMEIGANFITGYRFNTGLLFSLNYNAGLNNLLPGDQGGNSLKSSYFGLKVGYLFRRK